MAFLPTRSKRCRRPIDDHALPVSSPSCSKSARSSWAICKAQAARPRSLTTCDELTRVRGPMTDTSIEVEVNQRVALLRFNRPEQMNAITSAMQSALIDALDQAEAD